MKIGIISDHRGYDLKKKILKIKGITFIDYGTNSKETVDYPDYAFKLGKAINKKEVDLGIAICGSGIGMSIALNKVKGIISLSTTLFLDGWRLPWYKILIPLGLSTIVRFYYTYPECEPHGIKNEKTRAVIKKLLAKSEVGMNEFPMTGSYELLKLSSAIRKNLQKVTAPVLLFHSKDDDLTSIKSAEVVYNKLTNLNIL